MARLCPLFSGSKGNSTYISSSGYGILIDAGRSAKQIEKAFLENEIDINTIGAIFITHEHIDHIAGIKVLASRYKIRVISSCGTLKKLEEKGVLTGKFPVEEITVNGIEINGMLVKPFKTPHDCEESLGYRICTRTGKKACVATDIGYMTEEIKVAITGADAVLIESNHDVRMLQNGDYPYYLKRRILSENGHLSNESCAKELPELVKNGTTKIVLAHLSEENNLPELAFETSNCVLRQNNMKQGADFDLKVAPVVNWGSVNVEF